MPKHYCAPCMTTFTRSHTKKLHMKTKKHLKNTKMFNNMEVEPEKVKEARTGSIKDTKSFIIGNKRFTLHRIINPFLD